MQTIKTGMNNKQMRKIALGTMNGKAKKPLAVPGTKYKHKAPNVRAESNSGYTKEDRDLNIKSKKKSVKRGAPMNSKMQQLAQQQQQGAPGNMQMQPMMRKKKK